MTEFVAKRVLSSVAVMLTITVADLHAWRASCPPTRPSSTPARRPRPRRWPGSRSELGTRPSRSRSSSSSYMRDLLQRRLRRLPRHQAAGACPSSLERLPATLGADRRCHDAGHRRSAWCSACSRRVGRGGLLDGAIRLLCHRRHLDAGVLARAAAAGRLRRPARVAAGDRPVQHRARQLRTPSEPVTDFADARQRSSPGNWVAFCRTGCSTWSCRR